MNFHIEKELFKYFPGMKIIAVYAENIGEADTEKIADMLSKAWQTAGAAAKKYGNAQSHPYIKPWGERMKAVGANRKQFPSSIEAMVRRAGKGGKPFHINPMVDFYNAISLKYLVTAGAYDVDRLENDMWLRFSKVGDTFTALDSDESIPIPAGEVSYADGDKIITRHYVYKQSKHALLTDDSKNVIFVSEILGELPEETAAEVAQAITDGLKTCFGIDTVAVILDEDNLSMYP